MKKQDSQGFNIPFIVIITLSAIVFGVVGWRIWESNQNQQNANNASLDQANQQGSAQTASSSQATTQSDPNEGYIVLSEWDVRFKPVEGLSGVQYFKPSSTSLDKFDFSTKDLIAVEPNCGKSGSVSVTRTKAKTDEFEKLLGQFNGYYYYLRGADAACSEDSANFAAESTIRNKLSESLNSLEPSK